MQAQPSQRECIKQRLEFTTKLLSPGLLYVDINTYFAPGGAVFETTISKIANGGETSSSVCTLNDYTQTP